MTEQTHKSGFVNIIGLPNVGKSTLMNALVGERLSIMHRKPQTTRHRILGILNTDTHQIVFSDTPGRVLSPAYKMHDTMNVQVRIALEDADLLIVLTDVEAAVDDVKAFADELNALKDVPKFLVLNKTDIADADKVKSLKQQYASLGLFDKVIGISALHQIGIDELRELIKEHTPEGPPYFPKDQLSDRPERFFVAEIIREKILQQYYQELPYSVEVVVESFKEREGRKGPVIHIRAIIFVMRNSQKAILIGKKGAALKALGTEARKEIEAFLDSHVFLELHVKVRKNWRDDERMLKHFGYKS